MYISQTKSLSEELLGGACRVCVSRSEGRLMLLAAPAAAAAADARRTGAVQLAAARAGVAAEATVADGGSTDDVQAHAVQSLRLPACRHED